MSFSHRSPDYSFPTTSAQMAAADERATFIRRTYIHLLGAILACIAIDTVILALFFNQIGSMLQGLGQMMWLFVLGGFMLVSVVADRWARSDTSKGMQYAGLGLYVVAEALILVPLLFIAQSIAPGAIQAAGIVTTVVFGGLTATVLITKADFSFLRWGIAAGGMVAMGLIVASFFIGFSLGLWFSGAMVLLACASILYSTSNVLKYYRTDQYVAASLTLFASVALLFWYVLQIFISLRD
ncbi:Bax inhibitor-1 family protein [Mariniblastus sp.]|jgi:FtsH-binding integral membrane protein|nr:Bax inhibitor-1 family protein [Mariniblastus sp.]